jgi:hypothetical protein
VGVEKGVAVEAGLVATEIEGDVMGAGVGGDTTGVQAAIRRAIAKKGNVAWR